ncbi:hypothetical protein IFM51744_05253 [Aspergillus udagawae]|nr:hypothetical protein IFM51744_05253 [Aspergillus udagawae]
MHSLDNAITAVDAVNHLIDNAVEDGHVVQTPAEEAEAREAKAKALDTLGRTISVVDSTLAKLRKNIASRHGVTSGQRRRCVPPPVPLSAAVPDGMAAMDASSDGKIKSIVATMSAEKGTEHKPTLANAVPTLNDMATGVGPIMDNFDKVLKHPYLDQFNATLNTVPVVGLKDQTIMYVGTKLNANPLGPPVEEWAVFSKFPQGVTVGPDDKVHFFPYKGDFYMSIGTRVWLKKHRPGASGGVMRDPELAKAVNNWPFMYQNDWEFVGDQVLPAADLAAVMPFSVLSADRSEIAFQLVLLHKDSSLQVLAGDSLQANNQYANLEFAPTKEAPSRPDWKLMTYWNNHLIGYDSEQNFWDLSPDFTARTYTISDKAKVPEPIVELTASEQGPIGIRSDGSMWKRLVQPPKDDKDPGSYTWKSWISSHGVTSIGVASPGVLLDLNLLTRTLQSRYIETQTALIPVMSKIRAFGLTHKFYLKELRKAADMWLSDPGNQDLAVKQGQGFVLHALTWANILGSAAANAQAPVNVMTGQLKDVERQLEIQLTILQDKLKGLEASLKIKQEYLSKLQAALWGAIAALLLSVAIFLVAAATMQPWAWAAAGTLFVGGLVTVTIMSKKVDAAAEDVKECEGQINVTKTAINELTEIVSNFQAIATLYDTLNTFFGRMTLDAGALKDMDTATAAQLGAYVLADPSPIDAAAAMTDEITAACTTYLDVLSKQGITLPPVNLMLVSYCADAKAAPVGVASSVAALDEHFHSTVAKAANTLSKGKMVDYFATLNTAYALQQTSLKAEHLQEVSTGAWYDVPALTNAGTLWAGFNPHAQLQGVSMLSQSAGSNAVEEILNEARPQVVELLQQTVLLAKTAEAWADKYPSAPTGDQLADAQQYQAKSIDACQKAESAAAQANNAFVEVNHRAQAFQQDLDVRIGECEGKINNAKAVAENERSNIRVPFEVVFAGGMATVYWLDMKKKEISDKLNATVNGLNATISTFAKSKESGVTFQGHLLTWQEMVHKVSHDLAFVYHILAGVEGQLMENPDLYREFIKIEWDELAKNSNDVLTVIGVHSPEAQPVVLRASDAVANVWHADAVANGSNKEALIAAVSSNTRLGGVLAAQAKECKDAFQQVNVVLGLPWIQDIVGYWDDSKAEKATLFDVAMKLRRQYVQMIGMEYQTVQQLYSVSILQAVRAENVQRGRLPLGVFLDSTLTSIRSAMQSAQHTSGRFQALAANFESTVAIISKNVDEITTKIASINTQIATSTKALRDKIIAEVADVIAIAFATGAMLVAFGVVGPVGATLTLAAKLGTTAALTAASIKLTLDSLSLDDLVETIEGLKSVRSGLETSRDKLAAVKPFFANVVAGVQGLTGTVAEMAAALQKIKDQIRLWKEVSLTEDDVVKISKSWKGVRNDCLEWMDMVHSQGITPMNLSLGPVDMGVCE